MTPANWTCVRCKNRNPTDAPVCICGHARPAPDQPRARFPIWIAGLPGLIIAALFMSYATVKFAGATKAINPGSPGRSQESNRLSCIETYGITLNLSEFYVPEYSMRMPGDKGDGPHQISTVIRGMARNSCEDNLKHVRISLVVHDDTGRRGTGDISIDGLAVGESKPFEKAWMGRVASYEITAER